MINLVWLIPAFPLAAFAVNGFFGRRWLHHATGIIAALAVGASAVVSIGVFLEVLNGHHQTVVTLYRWIGVGDFHVDVAALVDPLSSVMLLVVTLVSSCTCTDRIHGTRPTASIASSRGCRSSSRNAHPRPPTTTC